MSPAFNPNEAYMTAEEVATRYRVSVSTLANQRTAGTGLPFVKIGGRILYKVSDLAEAERAGSRGVCADTVRRAVDRVIGKLTDTQAAELWAAVREEAVRE